MLYNKVLDCIFCVAILVLCPHSTNLYNNNILTQVNWLYTTNTNNASLTHSNVCHAFPYFQMVVIKTYGSFVSFTLPLEDDGHVSVSENVRSSRFNLQIETIYVE